MSASERALEAEELEDLRAEVERLREERDEALNERDEARTGHRLVASQRDALRAVCVEQASCAQRAWKRGTDRVTHAELIGIEQALRAAVLGDK